MHLDPRVLFLASSVPRQTLAPEPGPTQPIVNVGYATYRGYHDPSYGLNIWKGIRYAAPPVGRLRWQAPVVPQPERGRIIAAVDQPPICPQSGIAGTPPEYGFNSGPGDEDCLFLNVYAPPGASDLPVLVWIHGGGYTVFGATYDPSPLMQTNDNAFITVEMQYRLGAFGFLASAEVHARGRTNAGLLDQRFALEWVQQHIARFGGDATRVTIAGESAGAGSVMLQAVAYGGRESRLFSNIIAASPYGPPIDAYNDRTPTGHYNHFLELAGCSTFDCLLDAPSEVLQNASIQVSTSGDVFGSVAFLPVVDGQFISTRPCEQLLHGHISGHRILVGNNANDGVTLSDPTIADRDAFNRHLARTFPEFTTQETTRLHNIYQTSASQATNDAPRFDTLGDRGPTAINQSEMATGLQQTVFAIYADANFNCPAQWLAEAFSTGARRAWKYQYSVTPAYHGADLHAYFATEATWPSPDFKHAMRRIWGNFIVHNTPVISVSDATANRANSTVPVDERGNSDIAWPHFTVDAPVQMDLNTTGGTIRHHVVTEHLSYFLREGPGVVNAFRLADAYSWEGGRGERCEFWRDINLSS